MARSWLGVFVAVAALSWPESGRAAAPASGSYQAKCSSCHGDGGVGNPTMKAPAIAGQDADYVRRQLEAVRSGLRPIGEDQPFAKTMAVTVKALSSEELDEIVAYVSALPLALPQQTLQPVGFRERGLYSGCTSCHGPRGQGVPELGAPRIGGQYAWYLREQLLRFRDGRRGAGDGDVRGQQMRAMALTIAEDGDVDLLANYVAGLKP